MSIKITPELLQYCETDLQRERIQILIDCNSDFDVAAKVAGVSLNPMYEIAQRVRNRAAQAGYENRAEGGSRNTLDNGIS